MFAVAAILSGALLGATAAAVPLALWTNAGHPNGLNFRGTMGVSFGDYDGDGFIDVFACYSGNLWRNVGGMDWEFVESLSVVMPPTERRYGAAFGDYDNDGLPDLATAPRVPYWGDDRFHLLHNAGALASFVDVAGDPAIVDVQPYGNAETVCWADVNGDGNLDLFVPAYPRWEGGPGNFFLLNQGPTGASGEYRFVESSASAGLDNPPGTARPEGAQFVDVDGDGDVDLYANGTLYQNVSTAQQTRFNALPGAASGIGLSSSVDEGAMFFDYDLDGDFDLIPAYAEDGVRIWENRGDGTFFEAEPGIVDEPMTGLDLGMSAEDWDNDGDIDFTTRGVFRRNMLVEEGRRHFTVAPTSIPYDDLDAATPAWGDWDKDGDLDCALGNWGANGRLYQNTTYTPNTPESAKGYLRVRAVRDSRWVARGLETEYGATAEVRVQGGFDPYRRRKFVASSHGYLNQNEYTLSFGLPPGARVDVSVDFPGLSADGLWRVDKRVNPALGNLDPAALVTREVEVTRCGEVVIDHVVHDAIPLADPRLISTARDASLPGSGAALPAPVSASTPTEYVGLAFDTTGATGPLTLMEIILEGQLGPNTACASGQRNLVLWDVTDAAHPVVAAGGSLKATTSSRNRRTAIPASIRLEPGRSYRLLARVSEYRETAIAAPFAAGPITVRGGLHFDDPSACDGQTATRAAPDPKLTALALRFGAVPLDTRIDPLGSSLRLGREPTGPVDATGLTWQNVRAAGYEILRCRATNGPCALTSIGRGGGTTFVDPNEASEPGTLFWYAVKAINGCAAGL